jgi:hypothetical protein
MREIRRSRISPVTRESSVRLETVAAARRRFTRSGEQSELIAELSG